VADLSAEPPFGAMDERRIGSVRLVSRAHSPVTGIAAFRDRAEMLSARLQGIIGAPLPKTGRWAATSSGFVMWAGRDRWFVVGEALSRDALGGLAALTDETHAWAVAELVGEGASDVLARLVPLDLHPALFAPGHVARAPIGHMPGCVRRTAAGFELWVWRSVAGTLVRELEAAMTRVAGRAALDGR